jgi:hypothetical protein
VNARETKRERANRLDNFKLFIDRRKSKALLERFHSFFSPSVSVLDPPTPRLLISSHVGDFSGKKKKKREREKEKEKWNET